VKLPKEDWKPIPPIGYQPLLDLKYSRLPLRVRLPISPCDVGAAPKSGKDKVASTLNLQLLLSTSILTWSSSSEKLPPCRLSSREWFPTVILTAGPYPSSVFICPPHHNPKYSLSLGAQITDSLSSPDEFNVPTKISPEKAVSSGIGDKFLTFSGLILFWILGWDFSTDPVPVPSVDDAAINCPLVN